MSRRRFGRRWPYPIPRQCSNIRLDCLDVDYLTTFFPNTEVRPECIIPNEARWSWIINSLISGRTRSSPASRYYCSIGVKRLIKPSTIHAVTLPRSEASISWIKSETLSLPHRSEISTSVSLKGWGGGGADGRDQEGDGKWNNGELHKWEREGRILRLVQTWKITSFRENGHQKRVRTEMIGERVQVGGRGAYTWRKENCKEEWRWSWERTKYQGCDVLFYEVRALMSELNPFRAFVSK